VQYKRPRCSYERVLDILVESGLPDSAASQLEDTHPLSPVLRYCRQTIETQLLCAAPSHLMCITSG
jgi:hypothetical protein